MKIKQIAIISFFLLIIKLANAQCVLSKKVANGVTTTETAETYIYNNIAKEYHAVALKVFTIQTPSVTKKTFLKVAYTATYSLQQPKFLQVNFTNAETITTPLKFTANHKSDNKQLSTKTYQIELNEDLTEKLNILQAQSVGVLSSSKKNLAEIKVTDGDMFRQLLNCLQNNNSGN